MLLALAMLASLFDALAPILANSPPVELVALAIPVLAAFSIAPQGSNRKRLAVAVLAAGLLAGADEFVALGTFNLETAVVTFARAALSSQVAYKVIQTALGDDIDLNDILGRWGLGATKANRQAVDGWIEV